MPNPDNDSKRKILMQLKAMARKNVAERLKSKYGKKAAPLPEEKPVEPEAPVKPEDDDETEDELLALLGGE